MKDLDEDWCRTLEVLVHWHQSRGEGTPSGTLVDRDAVYSMIRTCLLKPGMLVPYLTAVAGYYGAGFRSVQLQPLTELQADELVMQGLEGVTFSKVATLAVDPIQCAQLSDRLLACISDDGRPVVCHSEYIPFLEEVAQRRLQPCTCRTGVSAVESV